jgi:hypothetical protein
MLDFGHGRKVVNFDGSAPTEVAHTGCEKAMFDADRGSGQRPARCGLPLHSTRLLVRLYQPRIFAKTSGATMVASDSMMYFGQSAESLPQVIFSLGTAPEYEPKLVVESLIWQK